jgi:GMP synthase-like glutamine amidotransferase
MRIGIHVTSEPPSGLGQIYGSSQGYMMREMLGPTFGTEYFDVVADVPPASVDACDGYLITGSPAGVYDDKPWIAPLAEFVRQSQARVPMVGICFGHQLMAHALGGQVVKSPKGWGIGLHSYRVAEVEPWMEGGRGRGHRGASRSGGRPTGSRTVLTSDFTPLAYVCA